MLTDTQQVILTCLLGPEDKTAFKRFQSRKRVEKWALAHPEGVAEASRKQRETRPEAIKDNHRRWRLAHPETALAGGRNRSRKWKLAHPKEARVSNRKSRQRRYHSDPGYRLRCLLRGRLIKAVRRAGTNKSDSTMELTGCPWAWLEVHLESLFRPGMTWNNHGSVWQIDHVRPCASFNLLDPEQQRICFHWTNLQPLFAEENLKKGDKYVL